MDWARLGERIGQKLINPKTKIGFAAGVAIAGVLAVTSGADIVSNPAPGQCEKHPLRNVYRASRLKVIDTCVTETVTVVEARKERDGDYHVSTIPEHSDLINAINRERQHGYLLVEFVPGDPRPKSFRTGMRLKVTGTLVEDLQHGPATPQCPQVKWQTGCRRGWSELHPIFAIEEVVDPGLAPAQKAAPIPGEEQNDPR